MNTNLTIDRALLWIGLANVRPQPENNALGDSPGAFVAVVGKAEDVQQFRILVEHEMSILNFSVLALEDVEPLATRLARQELPTTLAASIANLTETSPVTYGTFHAYSQ